MGVDTEIQSQRKHFREAQFICNGSRGCYASLPSIAFYCLNSRTSGTGNTPSIKDQTLQCVWSVWGTCRSR
jgi:hypothetical protein